ncbi:major facilitator superfamily domain-containing protein [Emericellopsis atlantica]|uniref:Major facilitator superfamily domain-containing protein n=1 Tax=Emericellopsis atlantica TaxID=2614577 RepID=A0A9P8CPW6_9HYPO|nr:major facilitator superfamily domain-containing protein [Emericellopsis atlantica]KAG9254550.1 major facilitator superfamily domain-containing protein [Emericellopsis atlantica]
MSAAPDPEKGHARRSSDIERPLSHGSHSSHHDDDEEEEEDTASNHEKLVQQDNTNVAHQNDLITAATFGEPSGDGIFACENQCEPCRTRSHASSLRSRVAIVVPRAKRRGLFGRFALIPEVESPYDYKNSTKWTITAAIAMATAGAPMGSSIFYPALPSLSKDLGTTQTVANMSVALYMLAMSIFPLWWSSFSEQFGRRTIYLTSFSLFVVFAILCAVSDNMTMLIVFRLCTGGASASVQAVGAGTIADIWESFERGKAMSLFYLGPLLGPLLAPIFGGVLAQELGWQSTMWFLAIYGLCCFLLLFFCLPETLPRKREEPASPPPATLERTSSMVSAKVKTRKLTAALKRFFIDPLSVLLFLRFPPVLITVLVAAIAFGALFVGNISIQREFTSAPYNYRQLIVGFLYAPPGLGYITASFFGGKWIDKIMTREAKKANRYDDKGKLILLPEDRMRENMWIANSVYPLSLLGFGWTLRYGIHWAVPSVFLYFFGVSSMLVFAAATTMLTEFVRKKSSAGVAVNNFVRNILSCVGTVVANPWINAMGVGWVFTIISLFCLVAGFLGIWALRRNAQKWRKAMDKALENI